MTTNLLSKYTISTKLYFMVSIMLLVLIVMGGLIANHNSMQLEKVKRELIGLDALELHVDFLTQVKNWRHHHAQEIKNADSSTSETVQRSLDKLKTNPAYHSLGLQNLLERLQSDWMQVAQAKQGLDAFMHASNYMEQLSNDIVDISIESGLVYDAGKSQSVSVRILLQYMPTIADEYSKLQTLANNAINRKKVLAPEISALKNALAIVSKRVTVLDGLIGKDYPFSSPELAESVRLLVSTHKANINQLKLIIDNEIEDVDVNKLVAGFEEMQQIMLRINQFSISYLRLALNENIEQTKLFLTITTVLLILVMLLLVIMAMLITRQVTLSVQNFNATIANVQATGNFDVRAQISGTDEISQMAKSLNQLLNDIGTTINTVGNSLAATARGHFDQPVNAHVQGDLGRLVLGVNATIDAIKSAMNNNQQIISALSQGDFGFKTDIQGEGAFSYQAQLAATTICQLDEVVTEINDVMTHLSKGYFEHRVTAKATGDLLELKNAINASLDILSASVKDINNVMFSMAEGNLSERLLAVYPGDLGKLVGSINQSSDKLSHVLSNMKNSITSVGVASEEVAAGNITLNSSTQQQASEIERTLSAVRQITDLAKRNADNSLTAQTVTQKISVLATDGLTIIRDNVAAMNEITQRSNRISEITALIDSIAFQTNLLALNAAVEAARAGDHGRGFAVVASEVRTLAIKSAAAAHDIKKLVDDSLMSIATGNALVTKTDQSFNQIKSSLDEATVLVTSISRDSSEQHCAITSIENAMETIEKSVQQNAALVEETTSAAENMRDVSEETNRIIEQFKLANPSTHTLSLSHRT
jgi:methyl-accepting chemotaxis protein